MPTTVMARKSGSFTLFPRFACGFALTVAGLALVGWASEVPWLYRVSPRLVAMNPATAIAILFAATALLALARDGVGGARRWAGIAAAGVTAAIGAQRLVSAAAGVASVDLWLFAQRIHGGNSRMVAPTAVCLVLLGCGLISLDWPVGRRTWVRLSAVVLGATAAFSFAVLVAYAYLGTTLIPRADNGMALNTAACLAALAAGALAARPDRGLLALLHSPGETGVLARRLLLSTTAIPLLMGWLRYQGQQAGWFRVELGIAMMAVATVLLLGFVVWAVMSSLSRVRAERLQAVAALASSERRYRELFEASPSFICTHDGDGVLVAVNPAAAQELGYSRQEMAGRRFSDYMSAESAARFGDHLAALRARKRQAIAIDVVRRDGTQRGWLYIEQLVEEAGTPLFALGHALDVTERRQARDELARQAFHDRLTGIGNRALFDDRVARSLADARRCERRMAIFYFDLDGFKPINDTFGHDAGDHLLREIAGRLERSCRQDDTLARLGGDEFGLLAMDVDVSAAVRRGEALLRLIAEPVEHDGEWLEVTGSLGISFYPDSGDSQGELLRAADRALYRSKAEGRGHLNLASSVGLPLPLAAN
jgi:diguanylate cyclase (GGDEF)-like protein/PAS domain S-box-containing protein